MLASLLCCLVELMELGLFVYSLLHHTICYNVVTSIIMKKEVMDEMEHIFSTAEIDKNSCEFCIGETK